MRDLIFSVPWYLPTVFAIVGLALFVSGNRRRNGVVRGMGLAMIVVAIAWGTISYLVDTPRETCAKQSRQLVQTVVAGDWTTFAKLLEPGVDFTFNGTTWRIDGRDALVKAVKADHDQIGLKSAAVTDLNSVANRDTITVTISVWTNQDFTMGRPLQSEWDLDWRDDNGHWLLHEIHAVQITGVSPEQVRGSLRVR